MKADSRKAERIVALFLVLFFIIAAWISKNLEKAFVISVTLGVFAAVIQGKWDSRNDRRFWFILSILAVIHIVVVSAVGFPQPRVGIISVPFAVIDALVMWGLINWIEKRFPRRPSV